MVRIIITIMTVIIIIITVMLRQGDGSGDGDCDGDGALCLARVFQGIAKFISTGQRIQIFLTSLKFALSPEAL